MAIRSSNTNWNIFGVLKAVVLAVVGVVSIIQQCPIKSKPDISVSMEYPIKVEKNKTFPNTRNPDIIIQNNGPIKVVGLSADVKIYSYNTEIEKITNYANIGRDDFDYVIYAKEFEPFDHIKHSTVGVNRKNLIVTYEINVVFHRKADMEEVTLKDYFFIQDKEIFSVEEFLNNKHYNDITDEIRVFDPSKFKHREFSSYYPMSLPGLLNLDQWIKL